jgi:hypothetical protein
MRKLILVVAVGMLFVSFSTQAEVYVKDYKRITNQGEAVKQALKTYISGVGRGLWMANAIKRFFCVPKGFVPQGANFSDWVERAVKKQKVKDNHPIEMLLAKEIQNMFPCPKSK